MKENVMRSLKSFEYQIVAGGQGTVSTDIFWEQFYSYSGVSAGVIWGVIMPPIVLTANLLSSIGNVTSQAVTVASSAAYHSVCFMGDKVGQGVSASYQYFAG